METPAALTPSDRFNSLIEGLFSDIVTKATNPYFPLEPLRLLLIKLIWRRLRRMRRRFATFILAQFHAGTLPATRPSTPIPRVRAPTGFAQASVIPVPAASAGSSTRCLISFWIRHYELEEMLEEPETEALVAGAPQLGSVLRPLCRMLAIKPPAWLRLPRKPRRYVPTQHPPAPEWLLQEPHTVLRPDGSVWMHLGSSTHWQPGSGLTLEQARKFDPPVRIWPRDA